MQTKANYSKRNTILALAIVLVVVVFSSCSTKVMFLSSAVVPAAEGTVIIKEDANKNYHIKVNVTNLADSRDLTPPRNVYVLWLLTENNMSKNLGQIISSTGSMSSKLKASFQTVSSEKPSKIFITAENEADIRFPDQETVLITDFIRLK